MNVANAIFFILNITYLIYLYIFSNNIYTLLITYHFIAVIHPLFNKGKDKPAAKKGRPRLEHRKGK
jgi:membrane protein insertase Oxa1/YidC/SpoIIIJ